MKHLWNIIALASATVLMGACSQKEPLPAADEKAEAPVEAFTYIVSLEETATKAVFSTDHMAWQAEDQIGWFTDKAGSSAINMATTPRSFAVSSNAVLGAGSKVYAYAPYKAGDQSKTAAPLSIPVAQNGSSAKDAMPMVALPVTVASAMAAGTDTPIGTAKFVNLGAMIRYNVYTTNASYASEKVESVTFTSASEIAGDFTVDLTSIALDALPSPSGLSQKAVTSTLDAATTVGASKESGVKVYQVIAPGSYSGTITVMTDKAVYSYNLSTPQAFERSKMKPVSLDLAAGTRVAKIEYLLTAHPWVLKGVKEEGGSVTTSVGNILTLNEDHTMAFNCSANGGKTYDHTWVGGLIDPDAYGAVGDMSWSVFTSGGKDYLTVYDGFLLVFAQTGLTGMYEIKELTADKLTVEIVTEFDSWEETWTLLFEAQGEAPSLECPYWHTFADGDFGIGPAYDWGGWVDGYYFDMLTVPDLLDGAYWSITDAGYFEWAGTEGWRKGIQLGTGGMTVSSFKLSSASFPGVITSVTLGYNSGITDNSSLSVSCKVGGGAFGSKVFHGDGDYEAVFTGSASGEIEITITSSAKGAIYLYYLSVEYDPSGSPAPAPEYTPPVSATEPPAGYNLVWSDEFTAGESLTGSSSKWTFESGGSGWGNNEEQYYCPNGTITLNGTTYRTAEVSSEGTLQIKATKLTGVPYNMKPAGKSYISARMNSKESWKCGYFLMRAKLPVTRGCWSAFWMLPLNGSAYVRDDNMDGGELDILEHVPTEAEEENKIYFSAHSYYATGEAEGEGDYVGYVDPATQIQYSYHAWKTVSSAADWHTYSMLWTDEFIRAYIDGVEYYYAPNPYPGKVNLPYWGFSQEFYLKLNLAVGGNWGGSNGIASDFGTQTFEIDYIRVYQPAAPAL